jgi:hypothetical protein
MRIGLCSATFLVLLVFRLAGVIDTPWVLITAPLWAPLMVILSILCLIDACEAEEKGEEKGEEKHGPLA